MGVYINMKTALKKTTTLLAFQWTPFLPENIQCVFYIIFQDFSHTTAADPHPPAELEL